MWPASWLVCAEVSLCWLESEPAERSGSKSMVGIQTARFQLVLCSCILATPSAMLSRLPQRSAKGEGLRGGDLPLHFAGPPTPGFQ